MKLIKEGAEARLFLVTEGRRKILLKERIQKNYRNIILDNSLRKSRTRTEEKMLRRARALGLCVPEIISVQENSIKMEFVEGKTAKEVVAENGKADFFQMGKGIALLHENNLIHGDLTTSNMIAKGKNIFFVDFGLALHSKKIEDKSVDLLNLKKNIQATHPVQFEKAWKQIVEGYISVLGKLETIRYIEKIEKRARYKGGL